MGGGVNALKNSQGESQSGSCTSMKVNDKVEKESMKVKINDD